MGRVIKQSAGNAISNYLGVAIGAINILVLYPRAFADNPEYFGLVQLLISYGIVVATFTNLGTPRIIVRYFPHLEKENKPALLGFAFLYPLPLLIVLYTLILIFQDSLIPLLSDDNLFIENWFYILPLALFNVYFEIMASIAQSYFKTQLPIFLKEVERRLTFSLLIILYWVGWINLQWFLFLIVASMIIQLAILLRFLIINKYLQLRWSPRILELGPMLIYGSFVFLAGAGNYLVNKIDVMMIGSMIDLEQVAYYSVAFFIGGVLNVPGKSLVNVTRPMLAEAFAKGEFKEVERLYKSAAINLSVIGIFFFLLLVINIDDILYLLPPAYRDGDTVILLIALAQIVDITAGQNGEIIALSKHYKFNLIALGLLVVLTITNNLIFIPTLGIEGAALATLISMAIYNLIKGVYLYKSFGISPYTSQSFYLFPLFAFTFFATYFLNLFNNPILDIITRSVAVVIIFIPLMYWLNISPDLNSLIRKFRNHVAK